MTYVFERSPIPVLTVYHGRFQREEAELTVKKKAIKIIQVLGLDSSSSRSNLGLVLKINQEDLLIDQIWFVREKETSSMAPSFLAYITSRKIERQNIVYFDNEYCENSSEWQKCEDIHIPIWSLNADVHRCGQLSLHLFFCKPLVIWPQVIFNFF